MTESFRLLVTRQIGSVDLFCVCTDRAAAVGLWLDQSLSSNAQYNNSWFSFYQILSCLPIYNGKEREFRLLAPPLVIWDDGPFTTDKITNLLMNEFASTFARNQCLHACMYHRLGPEAKQW
jgi:hypothetical protein